MPRASHATAKPPEEVEIQNRFAGRPLVFRIPGRSVRLGPGEKIRVPRPSLESPELKCLCADALIAVSEIAAPLPGRAKTRTAARKPASKRRPSKRAATGAKKKRATPVKTAKASGKARPRAKKKTVAPSTRARRTKKR